MKKQLYRSSVLHFLTTASFIFSIHALGENLQENIFEVLDIEFFKVPSSGHNIQIKNLKGEGIEMQFPSGTKGPHINFYREFMTTESDVLMITAEGLPNQVLNVYWSGSVCTSISIDCKVAIYPSEMKGIWRAEMSEHLLWRDKIKQLRIDFRKSGGAPFILRSVQIISQYPNQKVTENKNNSLKKDLKPPPNAIGKMHKITSNMFNLDMKEIFKLKRRKFGGGLGATQTELILLSGDGQLRVLKLISSEIIEPKIELPENNEESALTAANDLATVSVSKRAVSEIKKFLRYDDILVFENVRGRHLIVSYSYFDPSSSCFSHRLSYLRVPRSAPLTSIEATSQHWNLLFSSQPCFGFKQHGHAFGGLQSGGRMEVLDKDNGDIVFTLGDYTFDGLGGAPSYPLNLGVDYGKIFKINIHSKAVEPLSIGHRNPQGITVDSNGRIWATEHGPQGGDEINQIKKGLNFGWPNVSLGIQYGNAPWPFNRYQGRHKGYTPPTFAWVPSIGISNIDQSINFHPFWEGDLLVFSFHGNSIFRLRLAGNNVIYSEKIELPIKERVRYGFNHSPSNSLYIWTDSGKLYQITPSEEAWVLVEKSRAVYEASKNSNFQTLTAAEGILGRCLECHSGGISNPPDLTGILGKRIAGSRYTNYSDALKHKNGLWSEETLKAYLMNPQRFARGTSMPDPQINSMQEADKIIDALKNLGDRQ